MIMNAETDGRNSHTDSLSDSSLSASIEPEPVACSTVSNGASSEVQHAARQLSSSSISSSFSEERLQYQDPHHEDSQKGNIII